MSVRAQARLLLPLIVLAVAIGIFYFLKGGKTPRPKPLLQEKVWQVEVMVAKRTTRAPDITLYGIVESPEQLAAAAPGNGFIKQVFVRDGTGVKKGDRLVSMDRRDFLWSLRQNEAELKDIDSQIDAQKVRQRSNLSALRTETDLLALAEAEAERLVKLRKQNLSTATALNNARSMLGKQQLALMTRQLEVDSYPAQMNMLIARRERSQARVDESRLAMQRAEVHAPFDAMISRVEVSAGDRVSPGQTLVSLYPQDRLEIRAHLPLRYAESVQKALTSGQPLHARVQGASSSPEFVLTRMAGEAQTTGIDVYLQSETGDSQMRPGELLTLHLGLSPEAEVIAVPFQAIYGNSTIYLVTDGRLRAERVESVGQAITGDAESMLLVRSNAIRDGDEIATTHLPNAVSGLRVRTVENAPRP